MLIPLNIPAGVYRNGTDLQSAGRWRDASLVRWIEGTMQPIGGWVKRSDFSAAPMRGAIAWRDLSGDRWFAAGAYDRLIAASASNSVYDITPAGLTDGTADSETNLGYGGGFYGTGAYGVQRPDGGQLVGATTWALDVWGENLVACSSADGKLLEWDLDTSQDAAVISGAPTGCSGLFVTAERFLVALSPGGNFRKVQWSDREDNTSWTASATNEAGDIELQTTGQIMLGIRARGQSLILTSQDAHSMTYKGPPFVYGFERVGSSCGAVSSLCAAAVDSGVFWMGQRGFYVYAGGVVQQVPCDVSDYVFSNINTSQISKVAAVVNSKFSEVWWFYPDASSTENNRYVSYNYKENHWAVGELARTCGVDAGAFKTPIWFATNGKAYDHETGSMVTGAVYAESGPIQLGNGDQVMSAVMLIPDEKTQGQVTATFAAQFHPNNMQREYGPYNMANPVNVRFTGRQIAVRVTGDAAASWRWGVPRIDAVAGGLR